MGEQGKRMNASLTTFEPPETAARMWAFNDVGTCLFIMANAYEDLKMYPEAEEQRGQYRRSTAKCLQPIC